jgi:hypothetical protein
MRKAFRIMVSVSIGLLLIAAGWLLFLNFPQPIFRYHLRSANIDLYSDRPIPAVAAVYLDSARLLLKRSSWNDTTLAHRIFLCQSRWRFALLSGPAYKVGGQNSVYMNRNVWVRPVHWETGRVINHSGKEVPGDRTIPYYFAHELAHGVTVHHLGRWAYYRLPAWKREGYADYVARPRFDVAAMTDSLRAGSPRMDPFASGFYWRYQLRVQYLLEKRKLGEEALFREPIPVPELDSELLNSTPLPE